MMPSTIDDPGVIPGIIELLRNIGFALGDLSWPFEMKSEAELTFLARCCGIS
jgi:hypothetical protein